MQNIAISGHHLEYDHPPDFCPICHHSIEPTQIGSNFIEKPTMEGSILQLLYRCTRRNCSRAFIGTYTQYRGHRPYPDGPYLLRNTAPYYAEKPNIHEDIKKISPSYVEIYGQSSSAEAFQLDQIAGVGYRKALEFLIKDYAIFKNPEKEESIKKSFLGNCINDYVEDARVKECAKRAAWLGNDETHYVKKWEEKDIEDLKILIHLTENWIVSDLLTAKYLGEMPPTK